MIWRTQSEGRDVLPASARAMSCSHRTPLAVLVLAVLCCGCGEGGASRPAGPTAAERAAADPAALSPIGGANHRRTRPAGRTTSLPHARRRSSARAAAARGVRPVAAVATARPEFAVPLGLALGAIETYLIGPYQFGSLGHVQASPAVTARAERGASYAMQQLAIAVTSGRSFTTIARIEPVLNELQSSLSALRGELRGGQVRARSFAQLARLTGAIESLTGATGYPVTVQTPPQL